MLAKGVRRDEDNRLSSAAAAAAAAAGTHDGIDFSQGLISFLFQGRHRCRVETHPRRRNEWWASNLSSIRNHDSICSDRHLQLYPQQQQMQHHHGEYRVSSCRSSDVLAPALVQSTSATDAGAASEHASFSSHAVQAASIIIAAARAAAAAAALAAAATNSFTSTHSTACIMYDKQGPRNSAGRGISRRAAEFVNLPRNSAVPRKRDKS